MVGGKFMPPRRNLTHELLAASKSYASTGFIDFNNN